MKIDIKELSKINLEKGDVLVVKTSPTRTGARQKVSSIDEMFKSIFPNNTVIFARHTDTFEIIKQEFLK